MFPWCGLIQLMRVRMPVTATRNTIASLGSSPSGNRKVCLFGRVMSPEETFLVFESHGSTTVMRQSCDASPSVSRCPIVSVGHRRRGPNFPRTKDSKCINLILFIASVWNTTPLDWIEARRENAIGHSLHQHGENESGQLRSRLS